jgi:phosphoglycerate dehydrogenase-like enzyme
VKLAGPPQARTALRAFAQAHPEFELEVVSPQPDGRFGPEGAGIRAMWSHFVWSPPWFRNALHSLPDLQWVHNDFTGTDGFPLDEMAARNIVYTNGAGNQARAIAEWIVLYLLSAVKQFPAYVRQSDAGVWDTSAHLDELGAKVVLFIGFGAIAAEAARLLMPFEADVRAAVRRPRATLPAGVTRVIAGDAWRDELGAADFVVMTAPATAQTRGMMDDDAFKRMRRSAIFMNIGRGVTVDEDALVRALDSGTIAGAYLDCFVNEPLPSDHPLWRRPNAIVTPHWTWNSPKVYQRAQALFEDQLARYITGEPLRNVVDLREGY